MVRTNGLLAEARQRLRQVRAKDLAVPGWVAGLSFFLGVHRTCSHSFPSLSPQVSKDGVNWETLRDHVDDQSLNEPGSTATWRIEYKQREEEKEEEKEIGNEKEEEEEEEAAAASSSKEQQGLGWRHVRIQQNGKNASGQTHYLSLSGLELYGTVTGVCEELVKREHHRHGSF